MFRSHRWRVEYPIPACSRPLRRGSLVSREFRSGSTRFGAKSTSGGEDRPYANSIRYNVLVPRCRTRVPTLCSLSFGFSTLLTFYPSITLESPEQKQRHNGSSVRYFRAFGFKSQLWHFHDNIVVYQFECKMTVNWTKYQNRFPVSLTSVLLLRRRP